MGHRWDDDELLAPRLTPPPKSAPIDRARRAAGAAVVAIAMTTMGCGDDGGPVDAAIAPMPPPVDAQVEGDSGLDAAIAPMPPPDSGTMDSGAGDSGAGDSGSDLDSGEVDSGIIAPMPPPMPPPMPAP